MKLEKVKLHGFGQFNRGLEVSFSSKEVNLVIGRNEAGKSTLLNSIFGILFGFRDLNTGRKYEPWDEHEAYAGEVEILDDEGSRLRIWRDFKNNRAVITRLDTDPEEVLFEGSSDPRGNRDEDHAYYRALGSVLSFQDEAVFRNTVFFGQQSLHTAVSDQIRRLISGSTNVDYKGALHELHSRFAELTNDNPWRVQGKARSRLIENVQSEIEAEQQELQAGRRALVRTVELERELEARRESMERREEELKEVLVSLDGHEKMFSLLGRREGAEKRYQEALSRRDQFNRYQSRTREITEKIDDTYGHLRNAPSDFPDLVRAFAADSRELKREMGEHETEKRTLQAMKPKPNNGFGAALAIALLALGGILGATTALGFVGGGVGGVLLGVAGWFIGRRIGTGFKEEYKAQKERVDKLVASIKARKRRCNDILAKTGTSMVGRSADEVLDEWREYQDLKEELKRVTAAMKALGTQEEVDAAYDEMSKERGAVAAAIDEVREALPSLAELDERAAVGHALETLRNRKSELQGAIDLDRRTMEEARIELAGLSARMDFDLASLHESIQEKKRRLDRYDLERDALKDAIDTLDLCVKDFQESDVFRLGEEISGIFSRITGEKYSRVHLGSSMDPVISRGDHVPISPNDLSQGARDQLYFAMRIAMARHLSRNIKLPIFLDDPFVNFDADRLEITRAILEHLHEDHQVIMVTCDRAYSDWSDKIIDLDEVHAAA